jgi:hypothetical protein
MINLLEFDIYVYVIFIYHLDDGSATFAANV